MAAAAGQYLQSQADAGILCPYRSWLFSNDDPETILSREAKYAHVVIQGDVDVDVFDSNGDFIVHFGSQNNSVSYSGEDVRMPSFEGGLSKSLIYGERQGYQTLIILPLDQVFTVGIYSNKSQKIQVSYAEYSADKLHADVRYIYIDEYDMGEYYPEVFDPEKEREYTAEDLQDMGVLVVEPWSGDIVYSPTAVMRLENKGVPHISPRVLLLFGLLVLVLLIFLFILIIIRIYIFFKKIRKKSSRESVSLDI